MSVRVRFAPSPTGCLHVGNVRIAIINYIYALQNKGKFFLRIDDTDKLRSSIEFENQIYKDLQWLGLEYSSVSKQSENTKKYDVAFEKLKSLGCVYPCFETKEELAVARRLQLQNNDSPMYNRAALKLTEEEIHRNIERGLKPYWRFKLPDSFSEWDDIISRENMVPLSGISDPVIVRPDGSYVYTFASVVDDIDMGITHVIRGADHVTNTGVQIAIFKALKAEEPRFGHLPLIATAIGGDISKRTGSEYSIKVLREKGVEPFAIIAALATLGSSYNYRNGDRIKNISYNLAFHRISISSPRFDLKNIYQLSKKVLSNYKFEDIEDRITKLCVHIENDKLRKLWDAAKGNISCFNDIKKWSDICFTDCVNYKSADKELSSLLWHTFEQATDWNTFSSILCDESNYSKNELFHEIRLIMTGVETGPELAVLYELIDRQLLQKRFFSSAQQ